MAGALSTPVSWTESPSESMPSSGTGMRTTMPATTRAVRFFGSGRVLRSSSRAWIRMVSCWESDCPESLVTL